MTDKIVEEVHAVRRQLCEQCDFDFQKLGDYYMQLQNERCDQATSDIPTGPVAHPTDTKQG